MIRFLPGFYTATHRAVTRQETGIWIYHLGYQFKLNRAPVYHTLTEENFRADVDGSLPVNRVGM